MKVKPIIRIIDNFIDYYNQKGLFGVYQLRDDLKSKNRGSIYDGLVDSIVKSFEKNVSSGNSSERFFGGEDLRKHILYNFGIVESRDL